MTRNPRSTATLVTGCSSGIGRATALALLEAGYPVYASARRAETLTDLVAAGAVPLRVDVTDEESMVEAVEKIGANHGAVGVLVNNAGYGHQGPAEEVSVEAFRAQLETNLFGLARLTQLVLPGMREQGWGRVVNVSSVGGRLAFPGGAPYHASKWAVEGWSEALRYEVKPFGVGVSLVEPGPVHTRFVDTAMEIINDGPVDSPYAQFRRDLAGRIRSGYPEKGLPAWFITSTDEDVARAVVRAARSARPRTRYVVGRMARSLMLLRRLLPDSVFQAAMRTQFPVPRPATGSSDRDKMAA